MKIEELPNCLIDLAYIRHKELRSTPIKYKEFLITPLSQVFTWANTPERVKFWMEVNEGKCNEEHIRIAKIALGLEEKTIIPLLFN